MDKPLYIPVHVNNETQYIIGFGKKEMRLTIAAVILGLVIGFFLFLVYGQILGFAAPPIGMAAITFVLVIKDHSNESIVDKINLIRIFQATQKQYEYVYFNIYEGRSAVYEKRGTKADCK